MDYRNYILRKLLKKYEDSKAFGDPTQTRRISFHPNEEQTLERRMENADDKDAFLAALADLEARGIVCYDWQRFEHGNLVDNVWLCFSKEDALAAAYRLAGMEPRRRKLEAVERALVEALDEAPSLTWVRDFFADMLKRLRETHKLPALMPDETAARDLIRALQFVAQGGGEEIMERVFSLRCYGNTKYFEKHVKSRLTAVLKQYLDRSVTEDADKEEALAQIGIVKWPEVMEFCGPLCLCLPGGIERDYGAERYGAYLNAKTVAAATNWRAKSVRRVLFIENKANYTWYIEKEFCGEELVVYHGGHYSPMRGRFFQLIVQSVAPTAEFFHWSDIDLGGFRLFLRLKENIAPALCPYRMDEHTLDVMRQYGEPLAADYRKKLEKAADDKRYAVFHPVIEKMLTEDIRLEQESFLY